MKESTKRMIDWLTLPFLGYAIAAPLWFHYTPNGHPSPFWRVLLIFDLPFALAAIAWLGWRCVSSLQPMTDSTKRVIDWLTLPVLAFMPASIIWSHYTHTTHPPVIWLVLLFIDVPLVVASVTWLAFRVDEIKVVYWLYEYIGRYPFRRFLLILGCVAITLLIIWLWS
jgi:hypothetical protein